MPISIQCPSCKGNATVADSAVGKSVRCKCGTSFSIPALTVNDSINTSDSEISAKARHIREERERDEAQWLAIRTAILSFPVKVWGWFKARLKKQPHQSSQHQVPGSGSAFNQNSCPKCGCDWLPNARFCVKCAWDSNPEAASVVPISKPVAIDPSMLKSCPACHAPWLRFQIQCLQCNYDALKGRHVAPARPSRTDEGPRPQKATAVLVVLFLMAMGFVFYRFHNAPSVFVPQPKVSYEASKAKYAAESRKEDAAKQEKRADALDSLIRQMERTDAVIYGNRDFFRASVYVIMKTVPEKRFGDAWSDLVRVATFDPINFKLFKDEEFYKQWNSTIMKGGPDFESLPFAVRETFINFTENFRRMRAECIARGTTIEEEARKELGD